MPEQTPGAAVSKVEASGDYSKSKSRFTPWENIATAENFVRSSFPGRARSVLKDSAQRAKDPKTRAWFTEMHKRVDDLIKQKFVFGDATLEPGGKAVIDEAYRKFRKEQELVLKAPARGPEPLSTVPRVAPK